MLSFNDKRSQKEVREPTFLIPFVTAAISYESKSKSRFFLCILIVRNSSHAPNGIWMSKLGINIQFHCAMRRLYVQSHSFARFMLSPSQLPTRPPSLDLCKKIFTQFTKLYSGTLIQSAACAFPPKVTS